MLFLTQSRLYRKHKKGKQYSLLIFTKLCFEHHTNKKTLKQAWRFFLLYDLFVTQGGFEPPTLRAEI